MNKPKLHHYVPQFYLRRFVDSSGKLWVWDRDRDRIFETRPGSIAAESNFYYLSDLAQQGLDPLTVEKQLADLEREISLVTGQWIDWIRQGTPGDTLAIPDINRELVSLFLALQFLRTADTRSTLTAFARFAGCDIKSQDQERALHAELLLG